jgi:hypothetical protein
MMDKDAAAQRTRAARRIQAAARGRLSRRRSSLLHLACRVQAHYRSSLGSDLSGGLSGVPLGVVRCLEGRLLKLSGLYWRWTHVQVSNLHLRYSSRNSDLYKSINLAEGRADLQLISPDRHEFAVVFSRGAQHEKRFRAPDSEAYERWTRGLQQYLQMAQTYYSM